MSLNNNIQSLVFHVPWSAVPLRPAMSSLHRCWDQHLHLQVCHSWDALQCRNYWLVPAPISVAKTHLKVDFGKNINKHRSYKLDEPVQHCVITIQWYQTNCFPISFYTNPIWSYSDTQTDWCGWLLAQSNWNLSSNGWIATLCIILYYILLHSSSAVSTSTTSHTTVSIISTVWQPGLC